MQVQSYKSIGNLIGKFHHNELLQRREKTRWSDVWSFQGFRDAVPTGKS